MRVEKKADECPDGEIEACGGWYPAEAAEQDGEVDFPPCAAGAATAAYEPDEDWGEEADREGPDQGSVEGARAEKAVGADYAPEYGAVEMHPCYGACEAVDCFGSADVGDVGEHPVEDADLDDAGDQGGDYLDFEE